MVSEVKVDLVLIKASIIAPSRYDILRLRDLALSVIYVLVDGLPVWTDGRE